MRSINLLPPEAFAKAAARRRWLRIAAIGIVYVAVLVVLNFWWQGRVDRAEEAVTAQESVNAELLAQEAELGEARDLVARYDANVELLQTALSRDISWGRILNDLGRVIPDRVWLDTFTAAASPEGFGGITVAGSAFEFTDVSSWLRSLDSDRFPSVTGTWVTGLVSSAIGEAEVVSFSSSTALTEDSLSSRSRERIPVVAL